MSSKAERRAYNERQRKRRDYERRKYYGQVKKRSSGRRKKSSGCYIATAVYGSYDCPQVWALRRYRDNYLAQCWLGRCFIDTYYAISPTLVKLFGKTRLFNDVFKSYLDKKVGKLLKNGYSDQPYIDE
ncbi:MAG: hypothetical protein IJQ02_01035 [Oscillospiraceae bacterium]|nr:hypothetical protein [Oscillospiraceae bacterium]